MSLKSEQTFSGIKNMTENQHEDMHILVMRDHR